jgi:RNA polymerase sigma-70 factor (ECF subfamily)
MPFLRPGLHAVPPPQQPPEFPVLYREHARTVARWARHLGGPLLDVDDVVQEIFLVAQRRLPEFRGEGKLSTWLYRITERVVFAARRKDRLRRWWPRIFRTEVGQVLGRSRPTPIEELERRQDTELVYRLLDRVPETYRRIVILFELEELSGEEIANLTGLNLATVWVRLHRGRARLLRELQRETRAPGDEGGAA